MKSTSFKKQPPKASLAKGGERDSLFQFRKFCFLLIVCVATHYYAKAQVADYTFAYTTGTYTSISGTTVVTGTWDDANSALITLPFTFTYNGTAYTSVGINTNGFILMGAVNSSIYAACGLQGTSMNAIAGYSTDLINGSGTSTVQYTTRGTTPNRQFVAQWTNCRHFGSTVADHWSFQIILKETSNAIQVVWGTSADVTTMMSTSTCLDSAYESGNVGLLGSTVSDINLRSVTNGTNTWASSAVGSSLTSACDISPTNIPANGLTYTWTPPVPTPMTYDSSTTVFLRTTQADPPSSAGNRILEVKVMTHGTLSPLSVSALHLTTTGCTNAGSDIANAKVYYTGTSPVFSGATQFGSTVVNPNGTYAVNGSAVLSKGTNHFWVTYDIKSGATMGDTLRGCCAQITGSGSMGTRVPSITCPAGYQTVNPQTGWVPLATLSPDTNAGVMLLLTDGTVICKTTSGGGDGIGSIWDKLTPDIHGSYVNGTWSQIAPMNGTRLYFSSQILRDGRVYIAGGEYGTGQAASEVYDPLTDTWTTCPSTGHSYADANSEILPNGHVLQACEWDNITFDYDPVSNTYSNQQPTLGTVDESAWVKLPDSSTLFINMGTTASERYISSSGTWIADGTVPVSLYDPYGSETGPGLLLPDGRAFFFGSQPVTAYYTPSGNQTPGTWAAGPAIPNNLGCPDAGAAMMVNGRILVAVSPTPISTNHFPSPTTFFEFDYLTNSWTQLSAPDGTDSLSVASYVNTFLDLPDGSVLYVAQQNGAVSTQYYVYKPGGTPLAAGKPTIGQVIQTSCDSFSVTGTLFNGISEGAAYGDDWQMETNYPLVRLTATNGNVYYARTFNWNRIGAVQTGNLADTTEFALPAGLPHTVYNLVVTVNGNASTPVQFIPYPIFSSTLNPPAICSGSTFTYSPTTYNSTTTYTWTRAAVAGISNAAITTPQITNPNEVLVNTTSTSHSVIYQYILTDHGCSDTQLVTVVVNPLPVVSFSGLPDTICTSHGIQALTGNPTGGTFTGNGMTGNVFDPSLLSQGNDTVTYSFTDANGCINTAKHIVYVAICEGVTMIENSPDAIGVYPNPANGKATISFNTKGTYSYTVALYDLPGRKILEEAGKAIAGINKHEFSLNTIAKGIYFVELRTPDSFNKVKLVIQ